METTCCKECESQKSSAGGQLARCRYVFCPRHSEKDTSTKDFEKVECDGSCANPTHQDTPTDWEEENRAKNILYDFWRDYKNGVTSEDRDEVIERHEKKLQKYFAQERKEAYDKGYVQATTDHHYGDPYIEEVRKEAKREVRLASCSCHICSLHRTQLEAALTDV